MRVLLFGASGLVGGAVARRAAAAGHEVVGVTGRWNGGDLPGLAHQVSADLLDASVVARLVTTIPAEVLVNAAAVSEPAQCEAEPQSSRRLNVELPEQLAGCARAAGARLIHLSSEQVFDGRAAPYSVGAAVRGINAYARQKIEAEEKVHAADARAVTLRLPLLMGNSPTGRRSLHERLLALWADGKTARLYTDEIRQTCTADSVARALVEIIGRPELAGIFHWAGAEPASRFELGCRIRERFGLDERAAPITAVARQDDPAALASRQADLSLDLAPLDRLLSTRPQTLAEALAELAAPAWWIPG